MVIMHHQDDRAGDFANQDNTETFLGFLTKLIRELSPLREAAQPLSKVLSLVGEHFQLAGITIKLWINDEYHQEEWKNPSLKSEPGSKIYAIPLTQSNEESRLVITMHPDSSGSRTAFEMVAGLIDFSIAAQQLFTAEQNQRELLESINKISTILISTLDRDELLSKFLDQLNLIAPYDSASVMLFHDDGLLYMHAARGYDIGSKPIDIGNIAFIPEETFLMNEVLTGDEPIILNSTTESPQWTWSPVGSHIRSWMGVPLKVEGKAIGLFSLDKSSSNYFTEKHARASSALAKPAALALSNAMLFAEVDEARKELQGLSAKIIDVQENERQRVALELHDHSGQALLALRAELQVLRHLLSSEDEPAHQQIDYLDEIVVGISKDMERLAYDIRPPALKDLGLATILEQYIEDFSRRMQITGAINHDIGNVRLPENIALAIYRIVQEALTNLAKHAQADYFELTVNYFDEMIYLVISDDGVGMDKNQSKGFGLVGIRERLYQLRGTFEINSDPGKGTELLITIPARGEMVNGEN